MKHGMRHVGLPALAATLALVACSETATGPGAQDGGLVPAATTEIRTGFDGTNWRCGKYVATIVGTTGIDVLNGTSGTDVIVGREGNDTINGLGGDDVLCGGPGDDTMNAGDGNDKMAGEGGNDTMDGGNHNDIMEGGNGNDTMEGGDGDDSMKGMDDPDEMSGGSGNDTLLGDNGGDTFTGGPGADGFQGGAGVDTVNDFECEVDTAVDVENGTNCDPAPPDTLSPDSLSATKDSFLRSGRANKNEGINPGLNLRADGNHRAVIAFNGGSISTDGLTNATLVLTIRSNSNNWGTSGRTIDAHPLSVDFTEGNGKNLYVPSGQRTDGTGAAVTWNCATDTNVTNSSADCAPQWSGGTFGAATSPSVLITNGLSGTVSFDVTADVLAGATRWLVKKTSEGLAGEVTFESKEGLAGAGPTLLLTY